MIDRNELHAMKTAARFDEFGNTRFSAMAKRAEELGLTPADSIKSEGMSCFARTSHETFLRSPFCEDIHRVSDYDVAVVGIPYDSGASNRSGTRLGPAGIRHASSQISPFNPDYGVDLYEKIKLCDAGDIYTLPANAEKTFDQITKGIGYIFSQGVTPIVLGGDHSTSFPTLRGISLYIGGNCCKSWSEFTRDSGCTAISMEDIDKYGIDKVAELALDIAWKGCKAIYVSLDIDVLEAAFCPGTGTPDFGGMLPRELLRLLKLITAPGICGMDVVEVSPPFDVSEITSLAASRCIINVLCNLALNKSFYKRR